METLDLFERSGSLGNQEKSLSCRTRRDRKKWFYWKILHGPPFVLHRPPKVQKTQKGVKTGCFLTLNARNYWTALDIKKSSHEALRREVLHDPLKKIEDPSDRFREITVWSNPPKTTYRYNGGNIRFSNIDWGSICWWIFKFLSGDGRWSHSLGSQAIYILLLLHDGCFLTTWNGGLREVDIIH
jgi:hypothetical protein